jgi:signal transduction histidine kinase
MKNQNQTLTRLSLHLFVAVVMIGIFVFRESVHVKAGLEFYVLVGILTLSVTFFAGIVAIIKFDTRNKTKYILVSLGLLGAALLDGYYFIFKKAYFSSLQQNPSAAFFSVLSLLSYITWVSPKFRNSSGNPGRKLQIVFVSLIVSFFIMLFFHYAKLSTLFLVGISVTGFTVSLVGYIAKGTWKQKYFDQIFVASLIILLFSQIHLISLTGTISETSFFVSEVLKFLGFVFVLIGLLMSTYNAFKLAEQLGATLEARLTASIAALPLGYIVTNQLNEILLQNETVKAIVGRDENKQIESFLVDKLNIDNVTRRANELGNTIKLNNVEIKDKIVEVFVTPIYRNADYVGSVVLLVDVTEARKLDKSKDEFIALASHELRTPLVTIKGNIDLLKKTHPEILNDKDIAEIVDDVDVSSDKFIKIVNEFLDVSSLEQSRVEYQKQNFDLVELTINTIAEFQPLAENKNIKLDFSGKKEKVMVNADKPKVEQILNNLISNSIKFTNKGKIEISIKTEAGKVIVSVLDTGKGITKDDQKMLFKKFQQVGGDYYKHDSTQGVGLGLYLVKMLVEGMGGKIYLVKSKVGSGSEFAFELLQAKLG